MFSFVDDVDVDSTEFDLQQQHLLKVFVHFNRVMPKLLAPLVVKYPTATIWQYLPLTCTEEYIKYAKQACDWLVTRSESEVLDVEQR